MMKQALLFSTLSASLVGHAVAGPGATRHDDWDWSRTHTWLMFNIRGPLTDDDARRVANRYDIVAIGGLFDYTPNTGEAAQADAAAAIKRHNPNATTLIYRNSQVVIEGELHSDLEFQAHPEWIIANASGAPVYNTPGGGQPFINFTNPAARAWWVRGIVAAIANQPNGSAVDGVYVDGAGPTGEIMGRGLDIGQDMLLNASHALAVQELTAALHALRPGLLTIGNGAVAAACGRTEDGSKYGIQDWTPCARNLPYLDGVCAEHFGSFESVNGTTGDYDVDGGAAQAHRGLNVNEKWQTALDIVKRYDGGAQLILVKSWPGPFNVYTVNGNIEFTWKNLSDANVTLTNTLRKELGARALPWAHAAYLLAAAPGTYMSYGWWYQLNTGYVPCPDDPTSCSCPDEWYPALDKPTGAPLGPRRSVPGAGSGHVWTRDFERVSVTVDLANFSYPVSILWK